MAATSAMVGVEAAAGAAAREGRRAGVTAAVHGVTVVEAGAAKQLAEGDARAAAGEEAAAD